MSVALPATARASARGLCGDREGRRASAACSDHYRCVGTETLFRGAQLESAVPSGRRNWIRIACRDRNIEQGAASPADHGEHATRSEMSA